MGREVIGALLKKRRKELGMSVPEVLRELSKYGVEIAGKTLYGWENGTRQPDVDVFLILCKIYDISYIDGIDAISPSNFRMEDSRRVDIKLTDEERKHIEDYRAMGAGNRMILNIVTDMFLDRLKDKNDLEASLIEQFKEYNPDFRAPDHKENEERKE